MERLEAPPTSDFDSSRRPSEEERRAVRGGLTCQKDEEGGGGGGRNRYGARAVVVGPTPSPGVAPPTPSRTLVTPRSVYRLRPINTSTRSSSRFNRELRFGNSTYFSLNDFFICAMNPVTHWAFIYSLPR